MMDVEEVLKFLRDLKSNWHGDFIPQMLFFSKARSEKGWRDSDELSQALKTLAKRGSIRIGDNWEIYL